MKYQILETESHEGSLIEKLLIRSGVDNPSRYANTSRKDLIPHSLLENIDDAYQIYAEAIENNVGIGIIVDPDFDGVLSSSMLFDYIHLSSSANVSVYHHSDKQHGLDDLLSQILADVKSGLVGLMIVADAGTNDVDSCKKLQENGCKVIITDHHQKEKDNPYATIVNPQISPNYPNKYLSGTGVTWKFLQKIDDENWTTYANKYFDMVAMSLIADSMDIKNHENRAIIEIGFANIQNKMLQALIDKQSYSMGGIVDIIGVQFFISPLVNAMIRAGEMEEKQLMFKAFCEIDEVFDYQKKNKEIIQETIGHHLFHHERL